MSPKRSYKAGTITFIANRIGESAAAAVALGKQRSSAAAQGASRVWPARALLPLARKAVCAGAGQAPPPKGTNKQKKAAAKEAEEKKKHRPYGKRAVGFTQASRHRFIVKRVSSIR